LVDVARGVWKRSDTLAENTLRCSQWRSRRLLIGEPMVGFRNTWRVVEIRWKIRKET